MNILSTPINYISYVLKQKYDMLSSTMQKLCESAHRHIVDLGFLVSGLKFEYYRPKPVVTAAYGYAGDFDPVAVIECFITGAVS